MAACENQLPKALHNLIERRCTMPSQKRRIFLAVLTLAIGAFVFGLPIHNGTGNQYSLLQPLMTSVADASCFDQSACAVLHPGPPPIFYCKSQYGWHCWLNPGATNCRDENTSWCP